MKYIQSIRKNCDLITADVLNERVMSWEEENKIDRFEIFKKKCEYDIVGLKINNKLKIIFIMFFLEKFIRFIIVI